MGSVCPSGREVIRLIFWTSSAIRSLAVKPTLPEGVDRGDVVVVLPSWTCIS